MTSELKRNTTFSQAMCLRHHTEKEMVAMRHHTEITMMYMRHHTETHMTYLRHHTETLTACARRYTDSLNKEYALQLNVNKAEIAYTKLEGCSSVEEQNKQNYIPFQTIKTTCLD